MVREEELGYDKTASHFFSAFYCGYFLVLRSFQPIRVKKAKVSAEQIEA